MRWTYWLREVLGWVLVLLGLAAFASAYDLLLDKRIFQAPQMVIIGFIVFRGGIHLLKVAVAARAARELVEAGRPPERRPARLPVRPVGPTPSQAVLPGPRPPTAPTNGSYG